jgi:uncharacterized repeat protein (TIGR01451 family)
VLFGNGNGTFAAAAGYTVGLNPNSVAIDDFNGDHKPDLVVTNPGGNSISLLLNTGQGRFGPQTEVIVGEAPHALATGDFNKDEKLDLAVALPGSGLQGKSVAVLLGDGAGFFTSLTNFPVGLSPIAIVTADFNGDRKLDLAVANLGDNTVSLLLGDGVGGFVIQTAVGVGVAPSSIAVGDFNRDGKQDLAVGAEGGNIAILPGNGTGGFGSGQDVDLGPDVQVGNSAAAVLQDITDDGKLDLVAIAAIVKTNPDSSVFLSGASVAVGGGTGKFAPPVPISDPSHSEYWSSVAVANLNGDSYPDLVFSDFRNPISISTLFGDGTGQFTTGADFPIPYGVHLSIATDDFNGDHVADLAVTNDDNSVSILLGDGSGGFGTATNYPVGEYPTSVVVADFNKDQKADLALVASPGTVSILLGNGAGSFGPAAIFPVSSGAVPPGPMGLTVADFNGDGKLDIATANSNSNDVSVLLGKGNGQFSPPRRFPGTKGTSAIAAADFNGDHKVDLAVTNQQRNDVSILLGDGTGSFDPPTDFVVGNTPVSISVGDLNGDDKPDLAVANLSSKYVSILLNDCKPPPPPPPAADLQLTNTDSPDPTLVNTNLTYTLAVTNSGPAEAAGVKLNDTLPPGVTFVSASADCTGTSTITCALGTLAQSATATVSLVVKPTAAGGLSNTAQVSSTTPDPVPGNNTATAVTTVLKPSLQVLQPKGGEKWPIGSAQTLRWTSRGVSGNVKIELSRNGGATWETVFPSTANDGTEPWTVTRPATTQAQLRIRSVQDPTVLAVSNGVFTLGGVSLTAVSPNGGETWPIGCTQTIQWSSAGLSGNVKVEVSRDGGKTWAVVHNSTPNIGALNWPVTGPATKQGRVRVSAVNNATIVDISDANFSIQ